MDLIDEMLDIFKRYLAALAWEQARIHDNIEVREGKIYTGKMSANLPARHIYLPMYEIQIYPAYTEQPSMFGPRAQFAWVAEMRDDKVSESKHMGIVAADVVRRILEIELRRVSESLATDLVPLPI